MNLGLHVIKNPNNTYSFVGRVPYELGFTHKDGRILTKNDSEFVADQLRLPFNVRAIKTRVFQSNVAAAMIASELGYKVESF
jgi:hypothetical protein